MLTQDANRDVAHVPRGVGSLTDDEEEEEAATQMKAPARQAPAPDPTDTFPEISHEMQ